MHLRHLTTAFVAILATALLALGGTHPAQAAPQHATRHAMAAMTAGALAVHEINKVVLPDTSIDGPAYASVFVPNGAAESVLAWTGTDAAHRLNVETSADGLNYSDKVTLNETSPYRPDVALASAGGPVVLSWTGTDPHHTLNVLYDVYGNPQKLTLWGQTSLGAPAVTLGPGANIFLAWTDPNHALDIQPISITTSGGLIAGQQTVLSAFSSDTGPHLARRGANTLVLDWTAPTLQLAVATSQDGVHFSQVSSPQTSAYAPETNSLEPYIGASSREWISWTGTDPNNHLNLQWTTSFPQFPNPETTVSILDEYALNGPALGYNNGLQVAWTGTDADHHLNVATFALS